MHGSPGTLPNKQFLYVRLLTCTFTVTGKYKIWIDATIVAESPTNSSLKTAGRIRYFNTSGVQTANSGYIYNVASSDIVYIKEVTNTNDVTVNEFEVTFNVTGLTYTDISSVGYMQINMRYYTTCGGQAYLVGESYPMYSWQANTTPCLRNDKVWINPPNGSTYGSIAGTNAMGICNLPGSWVNPETHSVRIFDITGGGNTELTGSPFLVENTGARSISLLQVGNKYRFEYSNRRATFPPYPYGTQTCITPNPTIEIWQF